MDNKTYLGSVGEAKVLAELTKQGFHVFNQVSGKAPFDLIAYKDGNPIRVNVKTVEKENKYGNYTVQLKSVRSNRNGNRIINFDSSSCDLLAIYVFKEDRVILLDPLSVKTVSAITIKATKKEGGTQGG